MMVENCANIVALLALSFCLPVMAQEYQGWQFDSLHVHSTNIYRLVNQTSDKGRRRVCTFWLIDKLCLCAMLSAALSSR